MSFAFMLTVYSPEQEKQIEKRKSEAILRPHKAPRSPCIERDPDPQ